ncbi:MAG: hypothetical protein NUV69_03275 [Candidatus Curtissbacteria bacterium]|nr:hypothetical protein [Candidatus Curtissbacteria bacterium]
MIDRSENRVNLFVEARGTLERLKQTAEVIFIAANSGISRRRVYTSEMRRVILERDFLIRDLVQALGGDYSPRTKKLEAMFDDEGRSTCIPHDEAEAFFAELKISDEEKVLSQTSFDFRTLGHPQQLYT